MMNRLSQVYASVNPATGQLVKSFAKTPTNEIPRIISNAQTALLELKKLSVDRRAERLLSVSALLKERAAKYGQLASIEMGKPIKQGVAEVEKCAFVCEWMAKNGPPYLAPESVASDASRSYISIQPLGIVLGIFPWNFPFWQVARFASSAFLAGNVCIMKHAPSTPQCALALEEVFRDAGFPQHTLQNVFADTETDVPLILSDRSVRAVTLTGSCKAGASVGKLAGERIKKCVLELGGADPYLVLRDADVDLAVSQCLAGRILNTGQSCIAAKRWIVDASIVEEFTQKVTAAMEKLKVGDPMDPKTDVGPMAREDLRDGIHDQVTRSVQAGAKVLLGGQLPVKFAPELVDATKAKSFASGFWYPPTLLTNVRPGMAAFDEELFGPVACIIVAQNETEAVQLANRSPFGLGAAVFTRDVERGERIVRDEIESGMGFVNGFVKSDPRLPFGGVKDSGFGTECSHIAVREFTVPKTVWIR
ncbi:mitochondrial succinate-semialdehyde dehydrogenase/glutarate-semialdehyde dehydrogenase [Andalucia godoyi]|uniref:Mitochondrial succinate-semialdehyde dehydrogenase/glutarate-semialdehyde dehydrogenase n=1 Tax=Andalucia godoyi TaxID=505711 RepID=A0A8K0AGP6_ANDGO|nr:mitochondrial succinate-semialdehyde dehydrogenase/glutarate-semialdehyde dehydrogenase [Andalucia godoyi]|eukprot:ANDGO_03931.mRNA.1 mitochondrial succinate-semialdehyde dehydrogenase/glutarate-semialdehyde dehydrogenase